MLECTTAVAPSPSGCWIIGVAKVLSTMTGTPLRLAMAHTRSMSKTLSIGLEGVSSQTIFVSGRKDASVSARSVMSTKVALMPMGPMTLSMMRKVPP